MIRASKNDKELVLDILTASFAENKSVNYIIKPDRKRNTRIRSLMSYSFDICMMFGEVYLSNDSKACALILFPEKKRFTIKATLLDIKLVINCIGLDRVGKAMNRENLIKSQYPLVPFYYLWFIGVFPSEQGKGTGSFLLQEVINESEKLSKQIYLETSTLKNIPWYTKFGFKIYHELDFGYKLMMLSR